MTKPPIYSESPRKEQFRQNVVFGSRDQSVIESREKENEIQDLLQDDLILQLLNNPNFRDSVDYKQLKKSYEKAQGNNKRTGDFGNQNE